MCARRPTSAMPKPFFALNEPSAVPWWWCDLFWCHEVGCGVRWSNVVGCEVTWGEVMWLVATCHVMSCDVMWCDVMWYWPIKYIASAHSQVQLDQLGIKVCRRKKKRLSSWLVFNTYIHTYIQTDRQTYIHTYIHTLGLAWASLSVACLEGPETIYNFLEAIYKIV